MLSTKPADYVSDPLYKMLSELSLKKCWSFVRINSEPVSRIQFMALLLCGEKVGPRAKEAVADHYHVTTKGAAKWFEGVGLPKQDLNWFLDAMEIFNDDQAALLLAFDNSVRGQVLHHLRKEHRND